MSFKTIMVLLNDVTNIQKLLEASSAIARQHDAHVTGLYVLPAAKIYSDIGMLATPIFFEGYRDYFQSKIDVVRRDFEARLQRDGVKSEWRAVDSNYPDVAEGAISNARCAELIITSQIGAGSDGSIERDLTERLIMESGRPILIIPRQGHFAPRGELCLAR